MDKISMTDCVSNHASQPSVPILPSDSIFFEFFDSKFDRAHGALWVLMKPTCPPKFTHGLLRALRVGQTELAARLRLQVREEVPERVNYQVLGSKIPGVFSFGGDIQLFRDLIASQNKEALLDYAFACIDVVYTNAINYGLPITTISLVQGDALGGGFEAALAANVVVAERGCKMGLPEIMFNLFPGMGAYQLLVHRMPPIKAEQFITSGRTFSAAELYDMGVIDILAEPGKGEEAVADYIKTIHCQLSGRQGLRGAMRESGFLDYDHLRRVASIWADCALNLSQKDLDVLDFLIQAQATQSG